MFSPESIGNSLHQISQKLLKPQPERQLLQPMEDTLYPSVINWLRQEPTRTAIGLYEYLAGQPPTLKLVANQYLNPKPTNLNRKQ